MATMAEIRTVLDNHGFDNIADTDQNEYINYAAKEIVHMEPWPFREAAKALAFAGGSSTPSTSMTDVAEVLRVVNTDTGKIIQPRRYEWIMNRFGDDLNEDDEPEYYYFVGETMNFYPRPTSAVALRLFYTQIQATIATTGVEADFLLPERWHYLIVLKTLTYLYLEEDDLVMAQTFEARYERGLDSMRQDLWPRQHDRFETVQVVDEEMYEYFGT